MNQKQGCCGNVFGFTLTEVMMVVVTIAVLASLTLPRFLSQPERATVAEAANMLIAIRQGEEAFFLNNNNYCSPPAGCTWLSLGLSVAPGSADFVYAVAIAAGPPATFTATATRSAGAQAGTTITIDQTGTWGGTHPNRPV